MTDLTLEQRARDLLAAEYERAGLLDSAAIVRQTANNTALEDLVLGAIKAALQPAQQPVRCDDCHEPAGPVVVCETCAGIRCDSVRGAQQPGAQAVAPIEYNKDYDRTYIPLPGGWEIQTKGKGSTFRLLAPDGFRLPICPQPYLFEQLEKMARDIHASTHPQPPSIPEPSDEDVWSGCAAFDASPASAGCGIYGSDAILDVLTTYTARLRERIGGGS